MNNYYFSVTCYLQEGYNIKSWRYGTVIHANSLSEAKKIAELELNTCYPEKFILFDLFLTDIVKEA